MTKEEMTIKLGTHLFETYGEFCLDLVNAGYDLDLYYDGGLGWGNFTKVLVMVSVLQGATSYDEYLSWFERVKQPNDRVASKQLFARLTKIYTPRTNTTQTDRTRTYRRKTLAELQSLREATALKWIDDNIDLATDYIQSKKLP